MFDIQPLELCQVEDRSQARQASQTLKAEGREVKQATQDLEQGPRQDWELEPGTYRGNTARPGTGLAAGLGMRGQGGASRQISTS